MGYMQDVSGDIICGLYGLFLNCTFNSKPKEIVSVFDLNIFWFLFFFSYLGGRILTLSS